MSKTLANLFRKGLKNTISLPNSSSFSFKGSWIGVHNDVLMDSWHVGDFSSAVYQITVERDSNEKEIMQMSVIARPEEAAYNIYGRSTIGHELVEFTVTVDESILKIHVSPTAQVYTGSKLIFHATYAETIHPLTAPALVADVSTADDDGLNTFDASSRTFDNSAITFDRT